MKTNIIRFGESPPSVPLDRHRRPLHDLCISVMDRCNFRCPYCMPEEKFHKGFKFLRCPERLSFDEIIRVAQVFRRLGEKIEMYYIGG